MPRLLPGEHSRGGSPAGKPRFKRRVRPRPQVRSSPDSQPAPRGRRTPKAVRRLYAQGIRQGRVNRVAERERQKAQRTYVHRRRRQIARRQRRDEALEKQAQRALPKVLGAVPGYVRPKMPRLVTGVSYLDPRRAAGQILREDRAYSRSKSLYDPKTRTLYSAPSRNQVSKEYKALRSGSTKRASLALKRLDRWGYEGKGGLRAKPVGRVAVPESSLRRERKVIGYKPGGKPIYAERDRYHYGKHTYLRDDKGALRAVDTGFHPERIGVSLSKGLNFALKRPTSKQGTVARGPGGVLLVATGPQLGTKGVSGKTVELGKTFSGHVIRDAVNIGAQAVPSLYQLAAATYEAAKGDDKRAKKLWNDYKKTGVIPAIAAGNPKEALRRFGEHPVSAYLEVRGGQVALTRSVARSGVHAARFLAPTKAGRRAAANVLDTRRGEEVPGLGFVERRGKSGRAAPYSRDLAVKYAPRVGQRARDKRRLAKSKKQGRAPSILTKRDVELAVKERTDHAEGVSAVLQREARDQIQQLAKKFPPRYANVGRLILEGQVRPGRLRSDLENVLRVHDEARPNLSGEKLATNIANTQMLKDALADSKLLKNEHKAFDTLHEFAAGLNRVEQDLIDVQYLDPNQVKAKHVSWLTTHEGARTGTRADAVLTDAGLGRQARREAVQAAGRGTNRARREFITRQRQAARQHGETAVRVAQENRKLLRQDKGVKAAAKAYNEASRERQAARKYAHNTERARSMYTDAERAVAVRRLEGAEEQFTDAAGRLRAEQARVKKQAEDGVLRESSEVGPYGRSPTGSLSRLERARSEEAIARRELGKATSYERDRKAEERRYRSETRGKKQRRIPWMVDREGREITPKRIEELADKHGVDLGHIAYVSQRGFELSEKGAYYQRGSLTQRPFTSTVKRTGVATRQGVVDLTRDAVLEDAFRQQSKLSAVEANIRMLNSVGAVGLRVDEEGIGGFAVARDAKEAARKLQFDESGMERDYVPEMEVITLAPFYKRRAEIMRVADRAQLTDFDEFAAHLLGDFERARDVGKGGRGNGPYILVPKVALDRALQHSRNLGPGDFGKSFQVLTHTFRSTVLLTSIRWFTGNILEMLFRTIVAEGAGPRAWYTGRKLIQTAEKIDPKRGAELRASTVGGANFNTILRYHIRRTPDQFETPLLRGVAQVMESVLRPGKRASVAAPWRAYAYVIRNANRIAERQGQYAALGKTARREWREMTRGQENSMLLGEKAFADLARGALKTENQVRFAREVDTIIGKYDRFGPAMRYAMTTYAPFLAWYVNALKFIFVTLPGRHPVKTSILASTYAAEADKLRKQGLDLTLRGAKPPFLQGSLSLGGKDYRLQHYLPFGAVAEYDTISSLMMPQIGFLQQVAGVDFTGRKVRLPNGDEPSALDNLGLAMYSLAESMIPFVSVARRIRESGGSGAPFSTVWSPKSKSAKIDSNLLEGLERTMLNPFYPVAGKKSSKKSAIDRALDDVDKSIGADDIDKALDDIDKELNKATP